MNRKIYETKSNKKMRVFVFFSGGASAMKYLAESDPNYGKLYQIVGAFTNNENASGLSIAKKFDIPTEILEKKEFYGGTEKAAQKRREPYYREVLKKIRPYSPDIIVLSGYMDIVTYPIISSSEKDGRYTNRVLNIHPADLGVMQREKRKGPTLPVNVLRIPKDMRSKAVQKIVKENKLERAYKGEDAVTDAILNGAEYTQSTCHIAQEKFDEGPIIVQSNKFPVNTPFVKRKLRKRDWRSIITYGKQLQERMKWKGDGPAYAKALEVLAKGRLGIGEDGFTLYLDGQELPYCGIQLEERKNAERQ